MLEYAQTAVLTDPGPLLGVSFKPHHVGVAVRNIERALAYFVQVLGFRKMSEPVEVPSQGVRVCFVHAGPGFNIELVEGIGEDSPVARVLSQIGGGPYHLCFEVPDLDLAVQRLRDAGFFRLKRFTAWVPLINAGLTGKQMKRFAFMLTPDRQLIELCEGDGESA
ncbi:MAG TPA: VOC family protein [Planctomycetota bacterium]|nr:VOC family protein [Planctomycetota bacterium]